MATSVRVILKRDIYENGKWVPDDTFGEVSKIVDNGSYQFDGLDVHVPGDLSNGSAADNKNRIYGYYIELDLATVPDTYAVTKQYAKPDRDQLNSFLDPEDGSLMARTNHILFWQLRQQKA